MGGSGATGSILERIPVVQDEQFETWEALSIGPFSTADCTFYS